MVHNSSHITIYNTHLLGYRCTIFVKTFFVYNLMCKSVVIIRATQHTNAVQRSVTIPLRVLFDIIFIHFFKTSKTEQRSRTPLSVHLSVTARDFPAQGDNAVLVDLPWFSSSLGYANFLIGATGLERRQYPLVTETACGTEEEIEIAVADVGAPIALPEAISFATNGVTFLQEAAAEPEGGVRILRAKRRFELNLTEYPPEIYLGLKEALRDIEHAKDGRAVFEPVDEAAANADTRLLSKAIRYDIASPSCWTTTVSTVREILTYAGKPVWQGFGSIGL